jgi:hypothetical protein
VTASTSLVISEATLADGVQVAATFRIDEEVMVLPFILPSLAVVALPSVVLAPRTDGVAVLILAGASCTSLVAVEALCKILLAGQAEVVGHSPVYATKPNGLNLRAINGAPAIGASGSSCCLLGCV